MLPTMACESLTLLVRVEVDVDEWIADYGARRDAVSNEARDHLVAALEASYAVRAQLVRLEVVDWEAGATRP